MLRLLPMIMSVASVDFEAAIRRRKRNALLYGLAAILLLSAWFVGLWAAIMALQQTAGPIAAPLYILGCLVGTALLLLVVVAVLNAMHKRNEKPSSSAVPALIAAAALTAAPAVLRSRTLLTVLAVAGIGYAALKFGAGGSDHDDPLR